MIKNPPAMWETPPWVGTIPWRREWLPTPVFLLREVQGQRSLTGYSPQGHKESDTTEQLALSLLPLEAGVPRALSWVTVLLPRSCAGGSPVCPHNLPPFSHSAPSPAPTLLPSSGSSSPGASGAPAPGGTATVLSAGPAVSCLSLGV